MKFAITDGKATENVSAPLFRSTSFLNNGAFESNDFCEIVLLNMNCSHRTNRLTNEHMFDKIQTRKKRK